jgi:uncharacterized protein (DUF736 family)
MAYEQKEGSGALFKNQEKQSDNHPDYRGNIRINGQDMWLSAWIKTSKSGTKYMSLSAQPKEKKAAPPARGVLTEPFDDDIPAF